MKINAKGIGLFSTIIKIPSIGPNFPFLFSLHIDLYAHDVGVKVKFGVIR